MTGHARSRGWLAGALWAALPAACLLLCTAPCAAEPIAVIVSSESSVDQLTAEQVKAAFLGRGAVPSSAEGPLTAIDRSDSALRERFYETVADMPPWRMQAYFSERVFSGRGRPPLTLDEASAIARVRDNPQALTYIAAREAPKGCRIVLQTD